MITRIVFYTVVLYGLALQGQTPKSYNYEPNLENPYGLPNPEAPEQIKDFAPLIGECDCESISRKADQSWGVPTAMLWRFKYIMNGNAVQDETLKSDGQHTGSIRQFDVESGKWQVHFYSAAKAQNPLMSWIGEKNEEGAIVLYRDTASPQGAPGFYKISFYNIKSTGFDWLGEWVDPEETIHYPLWKISCKKRG